ISWITVDGFNNWKTEYFDEEGYLINTENAYDLKLMGDRMLPGKYEIIPQDEPGNKTILLFNNMIFEQEIDESFFSIQNMKRIK
ncbi:MAG: outer membrane lipoprotein-sorting protein, partial [Bacteroidales bacterium]|nr:outer membrane lipoprotein-sorting protein [Bacteroidales bacterium]